MHRFPSAFHRPPHAGSNATTKLRAGLIAGCALALGVVVTPTASAYPEFQQFVVKHSQRPVNCAMCHTHADGPEGTAPGQIGRLTPSELTELGQARAAFEPGQKAHSPILNAFGNHILRSVGKKKLLEFRRAPEQLANALPLESDLDQDGIPDVREFLEGTHPLIASDGNPGALFLASVSRNIPQLTLTLAATVLGLYGLRHLLLGVARATDPGTSEDEDKNP